MNLLLIIIILLIVLGGGGHVLAGPDRGLPAGVVIALLIVLLLWVTGTLR